jgi:hypothetical protein
MRFAYRPYDIESSPADPSEEILRPALKVRVWGMNGPDRDVPLWGILDTGADECVLPFEVAERIEPAWSDGVGLLTDYTGKPHVIQYGAAYFQIKIKNRLIRWAPVVAFDRHREDREALWGVAGFLEHFRVTFDGPGRHFTIRLPSPSPRSFTVQRLPGRRKRGPREDTPIAPHEQEP